MKLTLNEDEQFEIPEIIVNYKELTPKLQLIITSLNQHTKKIHAKDSVRKTHILVDIDEIYYIETIDRKTFIYLEKEVLEINYKLYEILDELLAYKFCQINKSTIINSQKLKEVKQLYNSRLEALLANDERLIVSRKFIVNIKQALMKG